MSNRYWAAALLTSMSGIKSPLSIINNVLLDGKSFVVQAAPYKLLIYEQGDFFKPHRDTQRSPSMFATLTISLPLNGEAAGGEFVVSHNGTTKNIDLVCAALAKLVLTQLLCRRVSRTRRAGLLSSLTWFTKPNR